MSGISKIGIKLSNLKFSIHLRLIRVLDYVRSVVGKFNAKFIDNTKDSGRVKIHRWQLRLLRCVAAGDVYLITGIYDKLIHTEICRGYMNFGMNAKTEKDIGNILCKNYKWHRETMHGAKDAIRFTWMNHCPINVNDVRDWEIIWSREDIRRSRHEG